MLTNANGLGGTPQWVQESPTGIVPPIGEMQGYGYNPADNSLVIFGLSGAGSSFNATWELLNANGAAGTPQWITLIPNGDPNSPPTSIASGYDVANRRLISLNNISASGGGMILQAWVLAPNVPIPKPHVLIIPGAAASTLRDEATMTDKWLSCSAILGLHAGDPNAFAALEYDSSGNPLSGFALKPNSILTQDDAISDSTESANQSVVDCDNTTLLAVIAAGNWFGAGAVSDICKGLSDTGLSDYRTCLEQTMVNSADGTLLQFNALITALKSAGYDWVAWPYDFRRDVKSIADDLYQQIDQLASDGQPVDIITHSLGSIVTAALIAYHPDVYDSGKLQQIISMGAPFQGALTDYLYVQGWSPFAPFLTPQTTQALAANWSSVYDLLPQWTFVNPISGGEPTNNEVFWNLGCQVYGTPKAERSSSRRRIFGQTSPNWARSSVGMP